MCRLTNLTMSSFIRNRTTFSRNLVRSHLEDQVLLSLLHHNLRMHRAKRVKCPPQVSARVRAVSLCGWHIELRSHTLLPDGMIWQIGMFKFWQEAILFFSKHPTQFLRAHIEDIRSTSRGLGPTPQACTIDLVRVLTEDGGH